MSLSGSSPRDMDLRGTRVTHLKRLQDAVRYSSLRTINPLGLSRVRGQNDEHQEGIPRKPEPCRAALDERSRILKVASLRRTNTALFPSAHLHDGLLGGASTAWYMEKAGTLLESVGEYPYEHLRQSSAQSSP